MKKNYRKLKLNLSERVFAKNHGIMRRTLNISLVEILLRRRCNQSKEKAIMDFKIWDC